jgi:hypothetical protein
MRPLTALIKDIPSIEFSFFVPETGKYGILKSDPIPIEIIPLAPSGVPVNKVEKPAAAPSSEASSGSWRKEATELPGIEIVGNEILVSKDLGALPLASWWIFLIIPLGILAIIAEIKIKQYLQLQKQKIKPKTSRNFFDEALSKSIRPSEFYEGMILAFLFSLKEKGITSSDINLPDQLSSEGLQGEIREYLLKLERTLFAEGKKVISKEDILRARELFSKLERYSQ